jgi:hypothetical protein
MAECAFKQFFNEVSVARRASDIDKAYELIAETMKRSSGIVRMVNALQIKKIL